MSTLSRSSLAWAENLTIQKKQNTILTMLTEDKYVDQDIEFTIDVCPATVGTPSVSADSDKNTAEGPAGGVNISNILGTKVNSEPMTGYYVRIDTSASGTTPVTASGWIDSGNLNANVNISRYFPITPVTPLFKGGDVSGTASAAGVNAVLSSTNNSGVVINASGTASRQAVNYNGNVSGFVAKSDNDQAMSAGTSTALTGNTYYLNGVTINTPSTGVRTFSITVPNGNTTATFVFNVDSSGNVTITES